MKALVYIVMGCALLGLLVWLLTLNETPQNSSVMFLIVLIFLVPAVGAFWMMYEAIRHEKHPLPMVLLAFLPFAFLWYYVERVRQGKIYTRRAPG